MDFKQRLNENKLLNWMLKKSMQSKINNFYSKLFACISGNGKASKNQECFKIFISVPNFFYQSKKTSFYIYGVNPQTEAALVPA
jgi:hypothetical protein